MRVVTAILVAALAMCAANAQAPPGAPPTKVVSSTDSEAAPAADDSASPKIVESIDEIKAPAIIEEPSSAEETGNRPEVPDYTTPTDAAHGEEESALDGHFAKLEDQLGANQENLAEITKQVAQSLHERKRLLLVGEEMHALMSLHKAAKMLNDNQKEIAAVEEEIKKLGEEAEELIRERTELKKQLEDELADKDSQLEATRGKLGELSQQLDSLHQEHDHAARLVSAWDSRAKAIRTAREKHEEMDAMEHMMGGGAASPSAADEVTFPADHVPAEATPDMSATDEDIAGLEQSIDDFAAKHIHGGKAEPAAEPAAEAPPVEAPPAEAAPAEAAAFKEMNGKTGLLSHNKH